MWSALGLLPNHPVCKQEYLYGQGYHGLSTSKDNSVMKMDAAEIQTESSSLSKWGDRQTDKLVTMTKPQLHSPREHWSKLKRNPLIGQLDINDDESPVSGEMKARSHCSCSSWETNRRDYSSENLAWKVIMWIQRSRDHLLNLLQRWENSDHFGSYHEETLFHESQKYGCFFSFFLSSIFLVLFFFFFKSTFKMKILLRRVSS